MITKEQYVEILDICQKYIETYPKVISKPMSEDFQQGMLRVIELIEGIVKKD